MATEVLRPQDCLIGPYSGFSRRKPIHGGVRNHRINRRTKVGHPDPAVSKSSPVTILRRGESLDGGRSAGRIGRNPGDVYAGSAFLSTSPPSPSSLPLPSFSTRKPAVDDSASRDLRRLLRLE
uniref:Uncharacterized protein n=1 Tax=Kalanchoe fedtschenkoi TaxID=63787 RepID=A0A7N0UBA4_KALFE